MPDDVNFEVVWRRIQSHSGEAFRPIRGGEFTYEVRSGAVWPDRTNRAIPRSHFEQAFALTPIQSTTQLQRLQGPSYLYAVLMDGRIRQGDW